MSSKTVAKEVVEAFRDLGVRHIFGVPSGGWVDYMEALRETDGIDFILTTHEGGAGMMAEVTGRLTGVPGVCFGTFGPGATNLTTGVGEALLDRSPMIALSDEMTESMRGRVTQMGIDHQALFAPLTKKTTRLRADAVRAIITDAAAIATSGRPGPVHIGLPVGMSAEPSTGAALDLSAPWQAPPASATKLTEASALFTAKRRPILAVGLGAVQAQLAEPIRLLAEKFALPVVLTPMAKGMLREDHPSYAGVLFHALSDQVGQTHAQADCVVAIGYDPVEFNLESWMPHVPLINVDVEPVDIDHAEYPDVIDVTGDIAGSLAHLAALDLGPKDWDLVELAERRASMFRQLRPENALLGPTQVLTILRDVLPDDGIMTCDVGAHTHLIGQAWPTPAPRLQLMTNGWSTMGFGIPAAIAAKLAFPEKKVCAVVGDGGFLMTAGELATAVRYDIAFVTIVLTDNDLALIRIKQQRKGNPIYGTPVRSKGTIGGDSIFGVPVVSVTTAEELRAALTDAIASEGPVLIEAIVSSKEYDDLVLKKDKSE
ncbi:thiamine pyrophosphate-binding protein [Novosphingobium aerophilum]|uniref:Thiamine pyrophosphate-binding protein n=1 Tax=Novosphingobium aerophilum TaxID=2839843 RepID=A0A7X1FBH0_9SPHN|nr:thiamine pyrophosphate-binding protein [Novosphingobium aerophilum]MBC2653474.1 thiamine pyrophosphate-binding protein [Novosphingobium aerophilum]